MCVPATCCAAAIATDDLPLAVGPRITTCFDMAKLSGECALQRGHRQMHAVRWHGKHFLKFTTQEVAGS